MIEIAMQLWDQYPWNLYADMARVSIEENPLLAFGVNVVAIDEAVAMLDPREKTAVLLRYRQGLKLREIAEQIPSIGDPSKNVCHTRVQQILYCARRHLREMPFAKDFSFNGAVAKRESEIDRKEWQLAAESRRVENLERELNEAKLLYARLLKAQNICQVTLDDCHFSVRVRNVMSREKNHTVCDVLAKASAFTDALDPLRKYLRGLRDLGEKSIDEVLAKFESLGVYSP